MTNKLNAETKSLIDDRVQGRDIEKLFDAFIEAATDAVLDDVPHPDEDDESMEAFDYIIEAIMRHFGYIPEE